MSLAVSSLARPHPPSPRGGSVALGCQHELALGAGAVLLPDGVACAVRASYPLTAEPDGTRWITTFDHGLELTRTVHRDSRGLRIEARLLHRGSKPVVLGEVHVLAGAVLRPSHPEAAILDRLWSHGLFADAHSGFSTGRTPETSHGCIGLTDTSGTVAAIVGFTDHAQSLHEITAATDAAGVWTLTARCLREGVELQPGETLTLAPLEIATGPSLAELLEDLARRTVRQMGGFAPKPPRSGWCSWYHYYGSESQADILANVRALAQSPLRDRVQVIQIDDGWNLPHNGHPRVWGDWTPGSKFPMGMKALCDAIHDAGFQAGLWLAPFAVEGASQLAQRHPDWLVQRPDADGPAGVSPGSNLYALDLTHPQALAFLDDTFARVYHDWGFDYVKIDFLKYALLPGRRHDPRQTSVQAFRAGMGRIYRQAGERRFVLACTAPLGPSVGLCDGMRIGIDVGGTWHPPLQSPEWAHGNCSVSSAARPALLRHWMNGLFWRNDPDCLVVRDRPVRFETDFFARLGSTAAAETLCLSDEEAGFWARLVWMVGGMGTFSEVWSELSPARQHLLRQALPVNDQPVRWVDWYADPEALVLRSLAGPRTLGVFNLGDTAKRLAIPAAACGVSGEVAWVERFSGARFVSRGETLQFPELPPHAARVWQACPDDQ